MGPLYGGGEAIVKLARYNGSPSLLVLSNGIFDICSFDPNSEKNRSRPTLHICNVINRVEIR